MTIYFDLGRPQKRGNLAAFNSVFRLAMSPENASRMLVILGQTKSCQVLPPNQMEAMLDRAKRELEARASRSDDKGARYEVPRLMQLECLFAEARRKRYGVVVWQDGTPPA